MREFPLDLGKASYKLEFDQFTSMNVEDMSEPSEKEQNLKSAINDVRSVRQEGKKIHQYRPVYRLPHPRQSRAGGRI